MIQILFSAYAENSARLLGSIGGENHHIGVLSLYTVEKRIIPKSFFELYIPMHFIYREDDSYEQ